MACTLLSFVPEPPSSTAHFWSCRGGVGSRAVSGDKAVAVGGRSAACIPLQGDAPGVGLASSSPGWAFRYSVGGLRVSI